MSYKKTRIMFGIFSGMIYAIGMAVFDYIDNQPFHMLKFLYHFLIFGLIFASIITYKQKT